MIESRHGARAKVHPESVKEKVVVAKMEMSSVSVSPRKKGNFKNK